MIYVKSISETPFLIYNDNRYYKGGFPMAKKMCSVCGKRAEGLGTYPTQFKDLYMCSDCY